MPSIFSLKFHSLVIDMAVPNQVCFQACHCEDKQDHISGKVVLTM